MWLLNSRMTDRIEYDRMARETGRDSARVLNDEDLAIVDPIQVAKEVFLADLQTGNLDVDDVEEAIARFVPAFVQGYIDEKNERSEKE